MEVYSKLLKALFFISFAMLGVGFGCHLFHLSCTSLSRLGAFSLIFSPALGFLYLTLYYFFKERNKKLSFLSFLVFLILFLNVLLQK